MHVCMCMHTYVCIDIQHARHASSITCVHAQCVCVCDKVWLGIEMVATMSMVLQVSMVLKETPNPQPPQTLRGDYAPS